MTRTVFQPAERGAHGAWSDPNTKGGPLEDVPGAVAPQDGETDVPTITSRHGHEVIVSPAGDVVVDLAQADPPDVGCVVDLAQWDVPAAGTSSATGHRTPDRFGGAGRLSPSWPSVLRVTNAFGTTDLIDARERPTP
jgi:hypothetical protein